MEMGKAVEVGNERFYIREYDSHKDEQHVLT
ncbi:hypothetical protein MHK_009064 [Candidatus Magnetomorum sp. HK-1]|nr:hypothetical protein MHK_009064 [Candidatus Magnetomorum sp. HK-1]